MQTLNDAYKELFEAEPPVGKESWEVARDILEELNPEVIGIEFAKWILWRTTVAERVPDMDTRRDLIDLARNYLKECFGPDAQADFMWLETKGRELNYRYDGFQAAA